MSRAYRLRVRETLRRVIRASDHVSSQLELLEILPAEQMAELLAKELVGQGYTANFGVVGDRLHAFDSGKTFAANEVMIRDYRRFEGVSDPDDMAIVYAIESQDGKRVPQAR